MKTEAVLDRGWRFKAQDMGVFFAGILVGFSLFLAIMYGLDALIGIDSNENALLESLEIACLLLASVLWLRETYSIGRSREVAYPVSRRAMGYGLSILLLMAAAREVNFGRIIGWSPELVLVAKWGLGSVCAGIILYALVLFIRHETDKGGAIRWFLSSILAKFAMVAVLALVGAELFDKKVLPFESSQLFEESLELLAYGTLLVASQYMRWFDRVIADI